MKDYPKLAMRTNKPGDDIKVHSDQMQELIHCMQVYTSAADKLDKVKASIVYGRGHTPAPGTEIEMTAADKELLHAVLGLATEGGEILHAFWEELIKSIRDSDDPFTIPTLVHANMNLVEEGGDFCWFSELMAQAINVPVDTWKRRNIAKLKARFPDAYSDNQANNRDKSKEEEALG